MGDLRGHKNRGFSLQILSEHVAEKIIVSLSSPESDADYYWTVFK